MNPLQGHDDDFIVGPASFKSFVHGRKGALERKNKNREEEQRRRTKKKNKEEEQRRRTKKKNKEERKNKTMSGETFVQKDNKRQTHLWICFVTSSRKILSVYSTSFPSSLKMTGLPWRRSYNSLEKKNKKREEEQEKKRRREEEKKNEEERINKTMSGETFVNKKKDTHAPFFFLKISSFCPSCGTGGWDTGFSGSLGSTGVGFNPLTTLH